MKTLLLVLLAIIAIILTIWLVVIPIEVVAGSIKAFRQDGWKGVKHHGPH